MPPEYLASNWSIMGFFTLLGQRSAARYVLLHEDAGGDGDLPRTWKRLWPEGWNLPLQV